MPTEPGTLHIAEKLLNIGGTAGILYIAIWFLVKTLKSQYENRIGTLETRSDKCEEDRRTMHQEIRAIQEAALARQVERVGILERLLKERDGD